MRRRIAWVGLALLVAGALWAASWLGYARAPLPEALAALESDARIIVEQGRWISFMPSDQPVRTGVIIYPGGRIDPRGFAQPAREIAKAGYLVVIVPMPFNIAATAPDRAAEVIASWPEIDQWVIGGHSVGGTMAARFVHQNPGAVAGLFIWASYPGDGNSLADRDLPVSVIYASEDDVLAQPFRVEARRHLLPAHTRWILIEGGDHHQFGTYEVDGPRTMRISREEQQRQVIEATLELLGELRQWAKCPAG
ncbi:MAG: hypothetical protein JJT85_07155 [Chromatiales bacterium]|nr:hypothetical protein [Chromatiales bacterium]